MTADYPPLWPSSSPTPTSAIPASAINRYALIELAHLPASVRTILFNEVAQDSNYWPLIQDKQQLHLQREGPWLLSISHDRLDTLQALDNMRCALHSWIETPLNGARLASHLAPAMVVEGPHKQRSLLRFYLPDIINQLYEDALDNPTNALFCGVTRWWYRNTSLGWTALEGRTFPKQAPPWQLTVNEAQWQALHGAPEVMQLAAELVDFSPSLFEGICVCERPHQVADALALAISHGLTTMADKRTFVYVHLSQGNSIWSLEAMQALVERAANREASLAELLTHAYQQRER